MHGEVATSGKAFPMLLDKRMPGDKNEDSVFYSQISAAVVPCRNGNFYDPFS
jgi:hypothetical protein